MCNVSLVQQVDTTYLFGIGDGFGNHGLYPLVLSSINMQPLSAFCIAVWISSKEHLCARYCLELSTAVISLDEHWLKDCIVTVIVADNTIESGFWRVGFFPQGFSHVYLVF